MNYLIDVNVWVALAIAGHVHHAAALEWYQRPDPDDDARLLFCRVTQKGLLRLLTNAKVMGANALSAAGAWSYYDSFRQDDRVQFAMESPDVEKLWREATRHSRSGPNFWTDAYLSAFAAAKGCTIVTFDKGFRQFRGARVHVLPSGQ